MSHVICVANFVGQSGKTSTVVNLAASLAVLEKKTLVVDCDPEGKTSDCLLADKDLAAFGLDDVLTGIVSGKSAVASTRFEYLDIIYAGDGLDTVDKILSMNPEREKILSIIIQKFKDQYDFIVFDTPSEKGFLAKSAVIAGDSLLIPSHSGTGTADDIFDVLAYSGKIRPVMDNPLKLSGILFNRCSDLSDLELLKTDTRIKSLKNALFPVAIPPVEPKDDPCRPACLCDVKSLYAEAFLDLCFEFLYRGNT